MRVPAVIFAALLLSGCAWMQRQVDPVPPPPAVAPAAPVAPKPETPRPHRPHAEHPAPAVQAAPPPAAPVPAAPDYSARCHAMAQNRADDAKQLGATGADQAKMDADTYRDCMRQSVK